MQNLLSKTRYTKEREPVSLAIIRVSDSIRSKPSNI